MRTKSNKKALFSAAACCAAALTGGIACLGGAGGKRATAEDLREAGGFVRYDASRVSVTEDYAAVVPFSTTLTGGSWNGDYTPYFGTQNVSKNNDNNQPILTDLGQTANLDNGKRGLLIESVQSGTEVEGAGVDFISPMEGNFSMDFRVFSEKSYYGTATGSAKNNDVRPDYYNTFLDAKEVGITISSATTGEAFTIYVRGSSLYGLTKPNARVWVNGETIENGDKGLLGYGLAANDGKLSWDYPTNTILEGSSFVNASETGYDTYTTLEFDVENMCVYGVRNVVTLAKTGSSVAQSKVLIRDLKNYPEVINGAGAYDYTSVKRLTDNSAFSGGYYVSVAFTDVTADNTVLQTLARGSGSSYHDYAKTTNVQDADGNNVTYNRHAKMIIYSLNGQDLKKDSGFTAEKISSALAGGDTWADGSAISESTEYKAKATGVQAEDAKISWKEKQTGTFSESFIVRSDDKDTQGFEKIASVNNVPKMYGGMGWNNDASIPALDVKEVAFDFVSASDSSKKFTLYVRASSGYWDIAKYPTARVHIPGDRIMNADFEYGYGLATGVNTWDDAYAAGTFNANMQSKLSGFMGTYAASNEIAVKFDAENMKVYGVLNGADVLIRDLAGNSGTNVPADLCASLSSADFENGYYVNFRFTDVCRDGFKGVGAVAKYNRWGEIIGVGGSSVAGTNEVSTAYVTFKNSANAALSCENETGYKKSAPTKAVLDTMETGDENELAPIFFGLFGAEAEIDGEIEYACGEDTGKIAKNADGKYVFNPENAGEYTFNFGILWNGKRVAYEAKAQSLDKYSVITFKNGAEELKKARVENGKEIDLSAIAPQIEKAGYTFDCWKDGDGNEYVAGDTMIPEKDIVLTAEARYGQVTKASISLDGTIGLNYYVLLPDAAKAGDKAELKADGAILKEVLFSKAGAGTQANEYKFTIGVAAKDYKKPIEICVTSENENGVSKSFSVSEYMEAVLGDETGGYSAELKALVRAAKNYCAAASNYFLGTTYGVELGEVTGEALAAYAHEKNGELPGGVKVLGTRLVLESGTAIRLYFTAADGNTACTVNGEAVKAVDKTDGGAAVYYIEIGNISAQKLDDFYTITVGENYTVRYSALSYVRTAILSEDAAAELKTVAKALYFYNAAANAYFA